MEFIAGLRAFLRGRRSRALRREVIEALDGGKTAGRSGSRGEVRRRPVNSALLTRLDDFLAQIS